MRKRKGETQAVRRCGPRDEVPPGIPEQLPASGQGACGPGDAVQPSALSMKASLPQRTRTGGGAPRRARHHSQGTFHTPPHLRSGLVCRFLARMGCTQCHEHPEAGMEQRGGGGAALSAREGPRLSAVLCRWLVTAKGQGVRAAHPVHCCAVLAAAGKLTLGQPGSEIRLQPGCPFPPVCPCTV